MKDIISALNNRTPRYEIRNASGLTVTIEKEDASCESIEAQLLDISVSGARIRVKEMVLEKEVLAVRIEVEHPRRVIVVSGNVCWITPAAGGDWSLGCEFVPPVPAEVLHDIAEEGILERREHGRNRVSLRTSVQWQLRSGTTSVRIVDFSRGGFCLCSQVKGKPREHILLQLESDEERTILVPGEIMWQVESQDEFVMGCQFLDSQDFSVLCELLDPIPLVDSAGNQPKLHSLLRRSRRVIVTCAAALLCIAIFGGLILSARIQTSEATQIVTARTADFGGLDSPPTHEATLATARNDSLDSVSDLRVKGVTTDAHKQEHNPSKTILSNNAARATDNSGTMASSPIGYRTWIDVTGRYRVFARIVTVKNNLIRLRKDDGQFVSVPLDRLSQGDVRFVRRWHPVSQ